MVTDRETDSERYYYFDSIGFVAAFGGHLTHSLAFVTTHVQSTAMSVSWNLVKWKIMSRVRLHASLTGERSASFNALDLDAHPETDP